MAPYRIDILTLFPDSMSRVLGESIIGRAEKKGAVEINCVQIRDYTENRQMQVDDYPYGGGWGLVMMAQPLKSCLDDVMRSAGGRRSRVIYMSPQGRPFNQEEAKRLRRDYDHLVLVCGHYEGVDERFIEQCVDEEISLGDFVLTGGEIAAMAVADCVCRMVPGVLADEECYTGESHWDGLLEYPQYTRPEVWEGRAVPEVLLTGDHEKVRLWRRRKQLERTLDKRPDMFERLQLSSKEDRRLVEELKYERLPERLKLKFEPRRAEERDIGRLLDIAEQAKAYLRESGVDQWQEGYPNRAAFEADIAASRGWVFEHEGAVAGYECVSMEPEASYRGIAGEWLTEGENYAVIHRTMAAAEFRHTSLSREMFSLAEDLAAGMGKESVRVDTHRDNAAMNRLLQKLGYTRCGEVIVTLKGPGHDPRRSGYEKLI